MGIKEQVSFLSHEDRFPDSLPICGLNILFLNRNSLLNSFHLSPFTLL